MDAAAYKAELDALLVRVEAEDPTGVASDLTENLRGHQLTLDMRLDQLAERLANAAAPTV
jgi:hypothetical protein